MIQMVFKRQEAAVSEFKLEAVVSDASVNIEIKIELP